MLHDRDFAYVARDRVTRRHMCHVFRCDTPARTIANTLRDICKKIMIERNLQHGFAKSADNGNPALIFMIRLDLSPLLYVSWGTNLMGSNVSRFQYGGFDGPKRRFPFRFS